MYGTKSVVVTEFGGYDGLKIMEFPLTILELDFVEVDVHFCGLNFADLYTRKGFMPKALPFILGMECTGVVTNIAIGVNQFKVGDKVICYNHTGGMFTHTLRIPEAKCFKIPDFISLKDACCLFVNYLTAYFAVIKMGRFDHNESILIKSCAGGVGWAATQLAKLKNNVLVYGTASDKKEKIVKENGVEFFINATTENMNNKFDVIIENESGDALTKSMAKLNTLGRLITIGANNYVKNDDKSVSQEILNTWFTETYSLMPLLSNCGSVSCLHLGILTEREPYAIQQGLNFIFECYKNKEIVPRIDTVFPMEDIVLATDRLAERRNIGKVLLCLKY